MNKTKSLLIAVGLTLFMGTAFAQTLTFTGDSPVQVSSGDNLVPARQSMHLTPGQTIMVPQGTTATITYENGTVLRFTAGTFNVPTQAVATATAGSVGGIATGTSTAVGVGLTAAIVGGVVVISAAAIDQNVDNSDPLSISG